MNLGVDLALVDGNKVRDYQTAHAAGVRFCFVRGSWERYDDPLDAIDADAIRAAGMVFGAYMLPVPGPKHPTAVEQVRAFANGGKLRPGDFPPVLDVEFPQGLAATGLDRAGILAWIRDAVKELRRVFGIPPMIYTSRRVWDGEDADALDADVVLGLGSVAAVELSDCPLWLARYAFAYRLPAVVGAIADRLPWPPTPAAWGDGNHWVHQYQGDSVNLPGFSSTVDLDRFRLMAQGETGRRVRWAQRRLRMAEGTPGVFDDAMGDAVQKVQEDFRLGTADRVIGPLTFARLAWL